MASADGAVRLKNGEDEGVQMYVRALKRADSGKYRCVLVDGNEVEVRAGLGGDLSKRAETGEILDGSLLQIKAAQYHADRRSIQQESLTQKS
eukprot:jgi/Pico_ML_1/55425/g1111.t1